MSANPLEPESYEELKRIAADFIKLIPEAKTSEELDNGWKCFGLAYLKVKKLTKAEEVMAPGLFHFVEKRYTAAHIKLLRMEVAGS